MNVVLLPSKCTALAKTGLPGLQSSLTRGAPRWQLQQKGSSDVCSFSDIGKTSVVLLDPEKLTLSQTLQNTETIKHCRLHSTLVFAREIPYHTK